MSESPAIDPLASLLWSRLGRFVAAARLSGLPVKHMAQNFEMIELLTLLGEALPNGERIDC